MISHALEVKDIALQMSQEAWLKTLYVHGPMSRLASLKPTYAMMHIQIQACISFFTKIRFIGKAKKIQ